MPTVRESARIVKRADTPPATNGRIMPIGRDPTNLTEFPYELGWISYDDIFVDHAPPQGTGYARPLSEHRLGRLRKRWDVRKMGTLEVSDRGTGPRGRRFALINGQHRMMVHREKGGQGAPCIIYHGLTTSQEAEMYLGFAEQFAQSRMAKFMAKLRMRPDTKEGKEARDIERTARSLGLEIDYGAISQDGYIRAVETLESVYSRTSMYMLGMVLFTLKSAYDTDYRAFQQQPIEGIFQFWIRYWNHFGDHDTRMVLYTALREAGMMRLIQRADAIRVAREGTRSLAFGEAFRDIYNNVPGMHWRRKLPVWIDRLTVHSVGYGAMKRREEMLTTIRQYLEADGMALVESIRTGAVHEEVVEISE